MQESRAYQCRDRIRGHVHESFVIIKTRLTLEVKPFGAFLVRVDFLTLGEGLSGRGRLRRWD